MKIAVIGSGPIGGTLGTIWSKSGHEVMFGSRDPNSDKMSALLESIGHGAKAGSVRDAINFGDAVLLAIPGTEIERVLEGVDFQHKIVMNSVNVADGRPAGMEVIRLAKNARVVRVFNTVPWEVIAKPQFTESNATMFINGDESEPKAVVADLCSDIGFDPVDAGGSANIPQIESAVVLLWRTLAPQFGRDWALKVIRTRPTS